MTSRRINWGLVGGGSKSLIGVVHRIAAMMAEDYRFVGGVFSSDPAYGRDHAHALGLKQERVYAQIDDLITNESALSADERMRLVTIATPNHLHYGIATKLVEAGFNVLCEKPMTMNVADARELAQLVQSRGVIFGIAHTYTGYPMVRQLRSMVGAGAIGRIQKVHIQYYQGWINPVLRDPNRRRGVWRLDPAQGGDSCCMGDIGIHAFNLVEYTTGLQVERVLADINTGAADNHLDVDGSVLLRLDGEVPGVLCASQIATGEENNLQLAIYGDTGALKWSQETPQRLEFLQEGKPLSVLTTGHPYNAQAALEASKLPPGHPEGFSDAMGSLYRGMARAINGEPLDSGAFPGVDAGVRAMRFLEAVLQSASNDNCWRTV